MDRNEIALNVCREFIRQFRETDDGSPDEESDLFLEVLAVREWQLSRMAEGLPVTPALIPSLRNGIELAESLLVSLAARQEMEIYRLVWFIVMELTKEIMQIEEAYGINSRS